MGSMIRDIANNTVKLKRNMPSRSYEALVFRNWRGFTKWDKKKLIEEGYERNAPFYAAANMIARTILDMPVQVQYTKNGKKHVTDNHPILRLIGRNETKEEFIERFVLYLIVTGESYAEILWSGSGRNKKPLGLNILPSQYVTPIYGDRYTPIKKYEFQHLKTVEFAPEDIICVTAPDLSNPFEGMSAGVPLAELLDLNNAAITWNKNVALAGGVPPIIAKATAGMQKEQAKEIVDDFEDQSGANNSHRLKIISEDLEIQELNTDPHDAEWHMAVLQSMRMILMSLGVSSSLMNDAANKTYNNVKDSRKALLTDSCLPIGHKVWRKISKALKPYFADKPEIVIDESNIEALQEDKEKMSQRLERNVKAGLMTRNEARKEMGLHVINDDTANQLIISNHPSDPKAPEPHNPNTD